MYKSIFYVLVHMYEYVGCAVEHRVLYIFLACCNLAAAGYAIHCRPQVSLANMAFLYCSSAPL